MGFLTGLEEGGGGIIRWPGRLTLMLILRRGVVADGGAAAFDIFYVEFVSGSAVTAIDFNKWVKISVLIHASRDF